MTTHDILKRNIDRMMANWCHHDSPTNKKVFKKLGDLNRRMLDFAKLHPNLDDATFSLLWNENWLHIYSNKYAHMIHNTAALVFENEVLRNIKDGLCLEKM